MKATDSNRPIMVGFFVLLGIFFFMLAVFTLAGKQKRFVSTIAIKAVFDDVSGLQTGNNIWFLGVKIGTVKDIRFYENAKVEITMNIEASAQQYIRKDAKAKVSSEGFIGNKNIIIYGGSAAMPAVKDGDFLAVEKALSTDDIMQTLQENNKNILAITNDFKQLSHKINQGDVVLGTLISDESSAVDVKSMIHNLQVVSAHTAQISDGLSRFTDKLNNQRGLINQALTDTTVFSDLKSAVAKLEQITISTAKLTNNLNQASAKLKTNDNAAGVLLSDAKTAESLKKTIRNLETSTQKLDENMEALQHNFLLKGFFKKKAKREGKK